MANLFQLLSNNWLQLKDICFNSSGSYLAVAGSDVRVYQCKQWEILKVVREHQAISTGVRFGKHAQYLATTSMNLNQTEP